MLLTIPISSIIPGDQGRLRRLNPEYVSMLAESIKEIGLQSPISVRAISYPWLEGAPVYQIVAGVHRLEACKALGWEDIPALIVDLDELDCRLWEIDENLMRAELTCLERAEFLRARKLLYEQKHPETRQGGARRWDRREIDQVPCFAEDTAAKTGMSEREVQRAVHRAKAIVPSVREAVRDIPEIADSGVELDALAAMKPEEQKAAVEAVKSGRACNVRQMIRRTKIHPHRSLAFEGEVVRRTMVWAVKRCRRKVARPIEAIQINCDGDAIDVVVIFSEPPEAA